MQNIKFKNLNCLEGDFKTMLFQLPVIMNLLYITIMFLTVLGYIFIVIAGAFNLKREGKLNSSIFFIIIGAVEILYEFLKGRLQLIIPMIMGYSTLSYRISYAIVNIIPYIISIITFGILIIIIGKRNKENYGKNLLFSGIFWIVYATTWLIINIYGLFPVAPIVGFTFMIISIIILAFIVGSRIFLLLYSIKIREKNLLSASIILLTATTVFIFYTIINFIYYLIP